LAWPSAGLGAKLGSPATVGEGTQNLLCGYLAVAVLAGLLANALFCIWWLDPVVALGIAVLSWSRRPGPHGRSPTLSGVRARAGGRVSHPRETAERGASVPRLFWPTSMSRWRCRDCRRAELLAVKKVGREAAERAGTAPLGSPYP
jgi:hypothetical protein